MKITKGEIIAICVFVGVVIFMGSLFFSLLDQQERTSYEMSNGVVCQDKLVRGFGGGTTFKNCSDDFVYKDPSIYKILEKKK